MTEGGLEVTAIDGMPVESETAEVEDDMEMDDATLAAALGGGME